MDEVISRNANKNNFWLADSYSNLPQKQGDGGTQCPIDPTWRSPFIGKSIQHLVEFVRSAPIGRGINKFHFLVLEKKQYDDKGWLTVWKRDMDDRDNLTSIPGDVENAAWFIDGYNDDMWEQYLEEWREDGEPFTSGL